MSSAVYEYGSAATKLWWEILLRFCSKFTSESNSERILKKIGPTIATYTIEFIVKWHFLTLSV